MAKSKKQQRANAPAPQQVSYSQPQPPLNPYYPDLTQSSSSQFLPPPPYSELSATSQPANISQYRQSVLMSHEASHHSPGVSVNYTRYQDAPNHQHQGASVIIQQVPYNHREERYGRKIMSFNRQLLAIGILSAISSVWCYSLYRDRPCVFNFTVHKPNKDITITISDVRDMHLSIAYSSGSIALLCILKSVLGFRGKSHSCYLFLVGVSTFLITLMSGYLAYLAFYTPCVLKPGEIVTNAAKTILSSIIDTVPSPDRGFFGESNVFQMAKDDRWGITIFALDTLNFAFYGAAFLTSILLC